VGGAPEGQAEIQLKRGVCCMATRTGESDSMKRYILVILLTASAIAQTHIKAGTVEVTETTTLSPSGNAALKQFTADNTIYVSVSGNDSNDGLSWGTAKATLAGALAALPRPGVVGWIKFGAGTWTFNNLALPAAASNLESIRITGINAFRSAPNGGPAEGTIFSNTSTSNPTIIVGAGTAGVTIEGIYFSSSTLNATTPHIFDNAGATGSNAQNAFINDYFQGGGYGIQISAPGSGSNFENYILSSQFSLQLTDCVHITSLNQGSASQITIRDSRCQLFGANGFYLTNASGVLIDNNEVTSNAASTGNDLFINAGGGAATTISNNELESLPASNAATHAMNLNGNSFSIFNNSIFNTTAGISCTCNNSTIGTNNFGNGGSATGYDVTLNAGSTANVVMPQAGAYPSGYFKDNSTNFTNKAFSDNGSGEDIMSFILAGTIGTRSNCSTNTASPAACGTAPVGTVEVPTTTTTYTVNTKAVTANSRIIIEPVTDTAGVGGTCNAPASPFTAYQSARSPGVSFTFTLPSTAGSTCWTYLIIN